MLASLDKILTYEHPAVVRRFQKEHPEKAEDAELLFSDLLMFFWASKKHALDRKQNPNNLDLDFIFIMDEEMRYIDQMWHVFLLYTEDYMEFCNKYFGEYLHHLPDIVPMLEEDFDPETNLSKFLNYVFDHLGEDVLKRWFSASC
jgi:hypothetical protein